MARASSIAVALYWRARRETRGGLVNTSFSNIMPLPYEYKP
jgi:hypothetical protein